MVSGFKTPPCDLSRIDSGEAKLMVILLKSLLNLLSFLKSHFFNLSIVNINLNLYLILIPEAR